METRDLGDGIMLSRILPDEPPPWCQQLGPASEALWREGARARRTGRLALRVQGLCALALLVDALGVLPGLWLAESVRTAGLLGLVLGAQVVQSRERKRGHRVHDALVAEAASRIT